MVRLPSKFHTRGWFAITIFFGNAVFWTLHRSAAISFQPTVVFSSIFPSIIFSIPTAIIALICWPKKSPRTNLRMALAGLLVIFFAFLLTAFLMGLLVLIQTSPYSTFPNAAHSFFSGFAAANMNTLGIPYVIAALLSQIFVSDGD